MKVGYLTASISRQGGGLTDSVRNEALALTNFAPVKVFGANDSDSASDLPRWAPLEVQLVRTVGPSRFSYAPSLSRMLDDAHLDVLSSHGLWRYTSIAASRWHAANRKPYIVSPHGMLDAWALQHSRWRKAAAALLFEKQHLREASALRALTLAEAEDIKRFGLDNPIAVIPNGVELPDLVNSTVPPWDSIDGFRSAKILLSLGRLHPKKNLMELLRAWNKLQLRNATGIADWRLVISGWDDGGYASELHTFVREEKLENSVWMAGPLFGAQKHAAYGNASGFVIPSLSEGLPMVVLEAWSYGLPVIMTTQCNLPEGFAAGAATRTDATADGINTALEKFISLSEDERAEMGRRGRRLCGDRFSWSQVASETEALLRWVLGAGDQPTCVLGKPA